MVKKIYIEILVAMMFVFAGTYFVYGRLSPVSEFWGAQTFWSALLIICWVAVALGYYHQGWKIHKRRDSDEVSLFLPCTVFVVQCVLFVKGIYYNDWSLVWGAIVVNSGVLFSLYQIIFFRYRRRRP